tara:strand:+ start:12319 stop:12765 length:447 start_codon:yes stop_codon:yes gene_type:complete
VQRHRPRVVTERRDRARVDPFPRDESSRAPLDARRANLSPIRRLIQRPTARAREGVSYEPQSIARARRRAPGRRHDAARAMGAIGREWARAAVTPARARETRDDDGDDDDDDDDGDDARVLSRAGDARERVVERETRARRDVGVSRGR